ncbi:GNAT family N-acetyltransferase [bacterium]|nr:GNAT family N-acetyltransferase [bacterium]
MQILPLTTKTLPSAIKLRDSIFKNIPINEVNTLNASLFKNNFKDTYRINNLAELSYFVVTNPSNNDVIALTGIYSELGDIDTAWLGWFGVDDSIRNNGIGQNLLDFSINQAKKLGFSHLNIYTYDSSEFQSAIRLYRKNKFIEFTPSFKTRKKDLYFKLNLNLN